MYIKPLQGKKVIDYTTQEDLPAAGKNVDDNDIYWHRRKLDGDIEILDAPPEEPAVEAPAATAKNSSK